MPGQQQFKLPTSKLPYEGPTRYEILHLISNYNAAHHDVDRIRTAGLTELDTAAVQSLITLDRERLFKHNPVDKELDILLRDIQQVKQISTEKDCKSIDWERLYRGAKTLKMMKSNNSDNGLKGLAKYASIELNQRQAAAKGNTEKHLAKATSNTDLRKGLEEGMEALRNAGKQIRKSQSYANLGNKQPKEDHVQGARKDGAVQWKDTEVRKVDCICGYSRCDFGSRIWMAPPCAHGGNLAKEKGKGRSPSPLSPREAQGNGGRPKTPGPAKLQKPQFDLKVVNVGRGLQVPMFVTAAQAQTRAKSPAQQDHHHTKDSHHQHRPQIPGFQPPANHQTRPKSPNLPQQMKQKAPTQVKKGTVYQLPPKTYVQSPTKHTVYQQAGKPKAQIPTQDTAYHPPKSNNPRPKSQAPRQHNMPYIPGQLNRPKSNTNLRQVAANDPTKDPANKAMYNKRPRIATDIKNFRMQVAHDDALRLASEIRKMG